MRVDAAAGRAAAGVLRRAYVSSVRTMRRGYRIDVLAELRKRDRRDTVRMVAEDMTGNLIRYLALSLLLAAPLLLVTTYLEPWVVRYVVTALVAVPASVPLTSLLTLVWWQAVTDVRCRRTGWPRLGEREITSLIAGGGLLAWRLAVVVGVLGALPLSNVPRP